MARPLAQLVALLFLLCTTCVHSQQEAAEERAANFAHRFRGRPYHHLRKRLVRPTAEAVKTEDVSGPVVHISSPVLDAPSGSSGFDPNDNDTQAAPAPPANVSSIADVIDKALAKEFGQESEKAASEAGKNFNETVESEEGNLETVVRIRSKSKQKEDAAQLDPLRVPGGGANMSTGAGSSSTMPGEGSGSSGPGWREYHGSTAAGSAAGSGGDSSGPESAPPEKPAPMPTLDKDVDRIIDSRDNEFVLSAPKDGVATLTLDPVLIQDLTFVLSSSAAMGAMFEAVRQPVINGYLVAGAVVGPGGFHLIKELVQVQSLAQLGVQLLLFRLGRELSFAKLRAVWGAALLGGMMQIAALMLLGGALAAITATAVGQGVFVGALLSMSSTSVVIKCLEVTRAMGSSYGQITIGTLILQDCAVGLMFALMPAFGRSGSPGGSSDEANWAVGQMVLVVLLRLGVFLAVSMAFAFTLLPHMLRVLLRYGSKELVQLSMVGTCLSLAWVSGHWELSEELGAFIAGAVVAVGERTLMQRCGGMAGLLPAPSSPRTSLSGGGAAASAVAAAASAAAAAADGPVPPQPPRAHTLVTQGSFSLASTVGAATSLGGGNCGSTATATPAALNGGSPATGPGADEHGHLPGPIDTVAGLDSVTNVMMALFVASMGLIMSPVFLAHHVLVLTLGTLVVMVVKTAITAGVVHLFGVPWRTSFAVGLSMAHIGEFSFVLLSMANQLKLLSPQAYMLLLGVTGMSLLTTPMVIMLTSRLLQRETQFCGGLRAPLRSGFRLSIHGGGTGSGSSGRGSAAADTDALLAAEGRSK